MKEIACIFVLWSSIFAFGISTRAQELWISGMGRLPGGSVQLTINGPAQTAVTLQGSSDLKQWNDLQTITLSSPSAVYTDTQAKTLRTRSYRLRTQTAPPPALPDLGDALNRVFPAPEGMSTIQYAPNGKLGFIAWRDTDLIFRERDASGAWREQVVTGGGNVFKMLLVFDFTGPREDYRFQPSCVLLYDANSNPHIFEANGTGIQHFVRDGAGNFTLAEQIADPQANASIAVLEGAVGANGAFHFAALSSGSPRNLTYGSNKGGRWSWTTISTVTDPPLTYWAPPFAARWLSMAVDSQNHAHIAFRTALQLSYDSASHPLAYSELKYATDASGSWQIALVQKPRDPSGEAANGASIAIAPDGKPRIVSWYDERADTGSAQESRLYFHEQDGSGNWSSTIIFDKPDGYAAGDGDKGTGFSPYLRYDPSGRAHILFLDHAGEHFGGIGQQEYAGNLRHAWWNGSSWSVEILFRQTAPLQQEIVYPAFAVTGNELAVTLLQRDTQWNLSSYPPLSNSKYYFRFFTKTF
jgi:hypothetical protein